MMNSCFRRNSILTIVAPLLLLAATTTTTTAFVVPQQHWISSSSSSFSLASTPTDVPPSSSDAAAPAAAAASANMETSSMTVNPDITPSPDWELDCYSRPVVVNGKKLWEVLVTDSNNSFRFLETIPSNQVNSKELKRVLEDLIDNVDVKPTTVRFFRGAMFNMINIALSDLNIMARPSRRTFALGSWLEERHATVYPQMDGYKPNMMRSMKGPAFLDIRTADKLPDALRGEQYAFVALPLAEFLPGGGVTADNIGVGSLCTLPRELLLLQDGGGAMDDYAPADQFVQGIVILSQRANALAAWLAGTEMVGMVADLRKRTLVMEADIDTQFLMARLNDIQRDEGAAFEEGKERLYGLHFISVQQDENDDAPAGFWLLRTLPSEI